MSRRIGHSECQTDSLKPTSICRMFVIFGSIEILWNVQHIFGMCNTFLECARERIADCICFSILSWFFIRFELQNTMQNLFSDPNKTWSSTIRSIRLMHVQWLRFDDGLCTICRELSSFSGETNLWMYISHWSNNCHRPFVSQWRRPFPEGQKGPPYQVKVGSRASHNSSLRRNHLACFNPPGAAVPL